MLINVYIFIKFWVIHNFINIFSKFYLCHLAEYDLLHVRAHELGQNVHVLEVLDGRRSDHVMKRDNVRVAAVRVGVRVRVMIRVREVAVRWECAAKLILASGSLSRLIR